MALAAHARVRDCDSRRPGGCWGGSRPLLLLFVLSPQLLRGEFSRARRAVTAIRSRTLDINTLMVVAVVGALLLGEWLEAASVVFLFAMAQWLEVRTLERARQAIRALIELSPREAIVKEPGGERRRAVESIRVGDEIVVRPGDKVPLDGVIISGHSDVNEAPLTGESLPVDKARGDEIFAGTINGHGALDVRVTRLVRDTRLARVIHLVETAQGGRAPVESFVDRFARIYTPAVLLLAVLVAVVPFASAVAMRPNGSTARLCYSSSPARARSSSRRPCRLCQRCRLRLEMGCSSRAGPTWSVWPPCALSPSTRPGR